MVSPKKAEKKIPRDTSAVKPVKEPIKTRTPIIQPVAKPSVDYKALLNSSPNVPYITTVEEAVQFVDEYARWKSKVKAAT